MTNPRYLPCNPKAAHIPPISSIRQSLSKSPLLANMGRRKRSRGQISTKVEFSVNLSKADFNLIRDRNGNIPLKEWLNDSNKEGGRRFERPCSGTKRADVCDQEYMLPEYVHETVRDSVSGSMLQTNPSRVNVKTVPKGKRANILITLWNWLLCFKAWHFGEEEPEQECSW